MSKIMKTKIIKDDINFLEYPNWVVDQKTKMKQVSFEKDHGKYTVSCSKGIPTHFDKLVFYAVLEMLFQKTKFESFEITTTRYAIATSIYEKRINNSDIFERIEKALVKWKYTIVHFEGAFYEEGRYSTRYFSFIDDIIIYRDTKEVFLRFNQQYIKQLRESTYAKHINFDVYKILKRGVSARLYEILTKSFYGNETEWSIGLQNLAEKLTLNKRDGVKEYYPSDVMSKLKPAINEINKKTELCIELIPNNKTQVLIFKNSKKSKADFIPARKIQDKEDEAKRERRKLTAAFKFFNALDEVKKEQIKQGIKQHSLFMTIPDEKVRIFMYMTWNNIWNPTIN